VRLSGEALTHFEKETSKSAAPADPGWDSWDDGSAASDTPNSTLDSPQGDDDDWGVAPIKADSVSDWADKADAKQVGPTPDEIFKNLSDNHEVDWDSTAWDVEENFDPFATAGGSQDAAKQDTFEPLDPNSSDDFDIDKKPVPRHDVPDAAPKDIPGNWENNQASENPTQLDPQKTKTTPPAAPKGLVVAQPATPAPNDAYKILISSLGISASNLTETPEETAARSGRMLRRLLAGLVTLLEARARAKDAMGSSATQLQLDGNNPLKFARDIDQALKLVMNPARPGYMEIDSAIEDSYRDLQAHQIATLKAMQGALKSTINRYAPDTIKAEAKENGFLTKILPGQRDAALWKAYEARFNGSVQGSAEAFFDTFSVEFRKAYDDAARKH